MAPADLLHLVSVQGDVPSADTNLTEPDSQEEKFNISQQNQETVVDTHSNLCSSKSGNKKLEHWYGAGRLH